MLQLQARLKVLTGFNHCLPGNLTLNPCFLSTLFSFPFWWLEKQSKKKLIFYKLSGCLRGLLQQCFLTNLGENFQPGKETQDNSFSPPSFNVKGFLYYWDTGNWFKINYMMDTVQAYVPQWYSVIPSIDTILNPNRVHNIIVSTNCNFGL